MKKRLFALVTFSLFFYLHAFSQGNQGIIPLPLTVKNNPGKFPLPNNVSIYAKSADELNVAKFLKECMKGYGKTVTIGRDKNATIVLSDADVLIQNPEGYELTIAKPGIKINARAGAGLFYGVQTLMQLLPVNAKGKLDLPFTQIKDQPFFKWRGVLLDVSRHFFSVDFVKRYLDILAFYKINTFHWHLTDDQGWRIEIKKYPKLTQIAGFRKETLIGAQQLLKTPEEFKYDGIPYGGYYTQAQIKDVVAYAAKRYITIMPEIEMPGHSVAVLAAYPELATKPGNYETFPKWGVSEDIVNPSEKTLQFYEDILAEVIQLFPGKYIHIGGDEAPKKVWTESEDVKNLMAANNIADVNKVQGWFNSKIETFLISKGKQLVGWDEILEGGITPSSIVQSWRGEEGGIEAAKHGNDVIMSPNGYVYMDYGQNPTMHSPLEPLNICCYLPLEKVYNYNPLPAQLTPELQKHILGTESTLFTEYVTTENKAGYMLFPRVFAIAEVGWTPYANKNFGDFYNRLSNQFARLDQWKMVYRVPEPQAVKSSNDGKTMVTLTSIVPGATIRYTLDNTLPDETSDIYTKPLALPAGRGITLKASAFAPNGRHSVPTETPVD